MWSEFKEHKRNKKASKPQIWIKLSPKNANVSFWKEVEIINLSDKAAFNVKVSIDKKNDFWEMCENSGYKELNIIEEYLVESTIDYEKYDYNYYFDFISKNDKKSFIISPLLTFVLLKAFLYDLIKEEDLYYKINIKYNNEEYYEYEEDFKIFFRLESITIYNEMYYKLFNEEPLIQNYTIEEYFNHDEIIKNKKEILNKIGNIDPNLVNFEFKILEVK